MQVTTANELLDRFLAEQVAEKTAAKRFRSDYLKVVRAVSSEGEAPIPAAELPVTKSQLVERVGGAVTAPAVSRYLKIIAWAIEQAYVELPGDPASTLGFPALERREMTPPWRHARVVYETVLRVATARRIRFEHATPDFWLQVFDTHLKSHRSGRTEVNNFLRVWRSEAAAGRVPDLVIPSLPSKKPTPYRLREEDWPPAFQSGMKEIRRWLQDSLVKGRGRKQKKRQVSVDQQINNVLRYGGYWANIVGEDISRLGWEELFSPERVLQFIFFTDPPAAERSNGHRYTSGIYQEGLLASYIDFCGGPLELPHRAQELKVLRSQFLFEKKRAPVSEDLTPDQVFGVANQLLGKAAHEEEAGRLVRAGVLRRDALLIALTMLWPRRVDVWHRLILGRHVQIPETGPIRIFAWKEESKPNKADQVLEVPPELDGLFRHYVAVDRPHLIGDHDDGQLFVAQGRAGVDYGTPRVAFRNRMREFLGVEFGTHALRKLWAPRYLDHSQGDYLTVMTILDTSMQNIITAYRDGQDRSVAKDYIEESENVWAQIKGGDDDASRG